MKCDTKIVFDYFGLGTELIVLFLTSLLSDLGGMSMMKRRGCTISEVGIIILYYVVLSLLTLFLSVD